MEKVNLTLFGQKVLLRGQLSSVYENYAIFNDFLIRKDWTIQIVIRES